ncbi:hypothetical protein KA119_02505 [Candidatus Gracilibacteria bacterium]|nr:hypothetical protein [Candidatus Gracilibacteria bacterium]
MHYKEIATFLEEAPLSHIKHAGTTAARKRDALVERAAEIKAILQHPVQQPTKIGIADLERPEEIITRLAADRDSMAQLLGSTLSGLPEIIPLINPQDCPTAYDLDFKNTPTPAERLLMRMFRIGHYRMSLVKAKLPKDKRSSREITLALLRNLPNLWAIGAMHHFPEYLNATKGQAINAQDLIQRIITPPIDCDFHDPEQAIDDFRTFLEQINHPTWLDEFDQDPHFYLDIASACAKDPYKYRDLASYPPQLFSSLVTPAHLTIYGLDPSLMVTLEETLPLWPYGLTSYHYRFFDVILRNKHHQATYLKNFITVIPERFRTIPYISSILQYENGDLAKLTAKIKEHERRKTFYGEASADDLPSYLKTLFPPASGNTQQKSITQTSLPASHKAIQNSKHRDYFAKLLKLGDDFTEIFKECCRHAEICCRESFHPISTAQQAKLIDLLYGLRWGIRKLYTGDDNKKLFRDILFILQTGMPVDILALPDFGNSESEYQLTQTEYDKAKACIDLAVINAETRVKALKGKHQF